MTKELEKKILNVQAELKAPKNQYNAYGKYKYRSCEDILEAVKPLLVKNQLFMRIDDNIVNIGNRFYIKATVQICDETGSCTSVSAVAREEESKKGMDGSQVTGASSSYARKYALNGMFLIDDTKDSDATNDHGKTPDTAKAEVEHITAEQIDELEKLGVDFIQLAKYYKVADYKNLTAEQGQKAIEQKKKINKEIML
jgi:hypothetical protein